MVGQDSNVSTAVCYTCSAVPNEPYIRCAECAGNLDICAPCFSVGAEREPHKNCHQYIVIKSEFPVFSGSTWKANEELELLNAVMECGHGNWGDISRHLQTHSAEECKNHYETFYISNPAPELPKFSLISHVESEPCFDYRMIESDEPPRYLPGSNSYRALGGYNAARSDFEVEYDNYAESLVSQLDPCKDDELGGALQAAIVSIYNTRLRERERRKRVIRDHGLILLRKTLSWLHRYEMTVTRAVAERLLVLMPLMSGMDLDYLLEGLHHAGELRQYIARLQELRENGLTRFHSCRLYRKLLRLREGHRKEMRMYETSPMHLWRSVGDPVPNRIPDKAPPPPNMPTRRPAPPLDIVGLPGYERLTPAERQLCSSVRLVPDSYLDFKRILMGECKRSGGLKLAQARTLIKIDVNKTRKLYDFLLKEGYVTQP